MAYVIVCVFVSIIFGLITQSMNESKGYEGGFAWGFWLSVIGVIVVACKPDLNLIQAVRNTGSDAKPPRIGENSAVLNVKTDTGARSKEMVVCASCKGINDAEAVFCKHCGQRLEREWACVNCNTKNEADAKFCKLGGTRREEGDASKMKRKRDYDAAKELLDAGKFDEAKAAFAALGDYEDSAVQVKYCVEAINSRDYNAAMELLSFGKYAEAYTVFSTLKGYKDVDRLLAEDENLAAAAGAVAAARDAAYQPGKTVTMGTYPQRANGETEPVEWQVLAREGDKALLISKYALDAKAYNDERKDITWEKCSLRSWLNGTFYGKCFNAEEQAAIVTTDVTADRNPEYGINPDSATQDKVFLFSITESETYFASDEARTCAPTAYAKAQGALSSDSYKTASGEAACWWWLRSPGRGQDCAASVRSDGSVRYTGNFVYRDCDCVRPALWVKVS